jgi:uncharacterized protein (TIGR03067 family)
MPPTATHPPHEELEAFALGRLDDDAFAAVEEHVADCPDCAAALGRTSGDSFTELLRSARALPEAVAPTAGTPLPAAVSGQTSLWGPTDAEAAEAPPALAGHPRYRQVRLLGSGGMGSVWLAEHRVMGRHVAVKVIRPELVAKAGAAERFRREAQAAARLSHPNIVAAYDADEAGDSTLLAMEYVEGVNLADELRRRGPLPIAEACDAVRQAALGLQHAFERGLVHRDLKPHNLMRAADGTVKVLDFGLAVLGDGAGPGLTGGGVVVGTPDYIAPEQAEDSHAADVRSDIYSLGCTLYHLLTGRVPFPDDSVLRKLDGHRRDEPAPVRRLRPEAPPALAAVVAKMMAKRPDQRYQTPAEVVAALEPFCRPLPQPAPRLRRPLLRLAAAALFAGLVLAGVAVYRVQTDNGEIVITSESDDVEVIVRQGGKEIVVLDTKTNSRVRLRSGVYELELKEGGEGLKLSIDRATLKRGETVLARIERVKPPPVAPKQGDTEKSRTQPPEGVGEVRRFEGHTGPVRTVAFSPDGRLVLSGSGFPEGDKTLRLWEAASGKEIRRFQGHTDQVLSAVFSPDGRRALSSSNDRTVRLWDVATGKEMLILRGHEGPIFSVAFSPDGGSALSGGFDRTVRLWDLGTGKEVRKFEGHEGWVGAVAFSPDGRRAVSGSTDGTVRLWDVATGKQLRSYQDTPRGISWSVAWSPDGHQVVFSDGATLVLWDVETGKVVRAFGGGAMCVAFSPDGRRVLSGGTDKVLRLWDVATGKELHHFAGHLDAIWSVAFSPDGSYALSGGGGQLRDDQWRVGSDWAVRLWRLLHRPPVRPDEELILGTWKPEKVEIQGEAMPAAFIEAVGPRLTFTREKMTVEADARSPFSKLAVEAVYHLDATKSPKTIDIIYLSPVKKTLLGIYTLEGDTLKLCMSIDPDRVADRATEFATKPGSLRGILTLRRQRAEKPAPQPEPEKPRVEDLPYKIGRYLTLSYRGPGEMLLSPDGRLLVLRCDDPRRAPPSARLVVSMARGNNFGIINHDPDEITDEGVFLRDGRETLFVVKSPSDGYFLLRRELVTGRVVARIALSQEPNERPYGLSASRDGRRVAMTVIPRDNQPAATQVIDLDTGKVIHRNAIQADSLIVRKADAFLTPDGRWFVSAVLTEPMLPGKGWEPTCIAQLRIDDLDVATPTRRIPLKEDWSAPFAGPAGQIGVVRDLPDGKRGVEYWDLKTGNSVGTVPLTTRDNPWVAVQAGGRRALVRSRDDKCVRVYDLPSGKEVCQFTDVGRLEVLSGHPSWRMSDDGRLLALKVGQEIWVYRLPDLPPAEGKP